MAKTDVEGTVRDFSRYGEGIVNTTQGVVFASGVLPGERVLLGGLKKSGGAMRAERVRVLDKSAQRQEAPCAVVDRCGGCPMMIVSDAVEAKFKRELVEQALRDVPRISSYMMHWEGTDARLAYRRRARLVWEESRRGVRIGYRERRSNTTVDVRVCMVLHPTLDRALALVHRKLGRFLAKQGEIHLALGQGEGAVLALRSEAPQPPELYREVERLVAEADVAGIALRVGGASEDAIFGDPRERRKAADSEELLSGIAGFSQAHEEMNWRLVSTVLRLASPEGKHVLELFAGSGNLTIALARDSKSLVAVEVNAVAAESNRVNLANRGLQAVVRADDAERFRSKDTPDIVILDPPRSGAPGAIRNIVRGVKKPAEVVYVSCDPPTLGRDLKSLAKAGYMLREAVVLDMFPQTAHVETVVRMAHSTVDIS